MDAQLLIDSIVRQTTVLIAQLATAVGVRAPLAHVADQVFVQLAREIEAQGVGRKVVADMFGLALRTYQRRVQRLTEQSANRQQTLWEAVIQFVGEGPVTRSRLGQRFRYDGEDELGAVLNDLVASGLLFSSGKGDGAVFRVASPEDRRVLEEHQRTEGLSNLIWHRVFADGPKSLEQLKCEFAVNEAELTEAVQWLLREGRLFELDGQTLAARSFYLPVGSSQGWEASVFDHFSAMAQAIAHKLEQGRSAEADTIGGSTFTFTVYPEHPAYDQVLSLLRRTRAELDALWQSAARYNQEHPIPRSRASRVRFYFGQDVHAGVDPEGNPGEATAAPADQSNEETT